MRRSKVADLRWKSYPDPLPVAVIWIGTRGAQIRRRAVVTRMNLRGADLVMKKSPTPGMKVTLVDQQSKRVGTAVTIRANLKGAFYEVVIAMLQWRDDALMTEDHETEIART
jgi:hypothetical protein